MEKAIDNNVKETFKKELEIGSGSSSIEIVTIKNTEGVLSCDKQASFFSEIFNEFNSGSFSRTIALSLLSSDDGSLTMHCNAVSIQCIGSSSSECVIVIRSIFEGICIFLFTINNGTVSISMNGI